MKFIKNYNKHNFTIFNNKNKENTYKSKYDENLKTINIIFVKFLKNTIVLCHPNEKVSDLIRKYRKKVGDNEDENFLFNGIFLDPSLTVFDSNLIDGSIIYVFHEMGKGGSLSMNFTDLSKNKTKEIYFSEEAPSYRGVTKGINICGICKFKKCKAYKNEVIVPINKNKIDLIK